MESSPRLLPSGCDSADTQMSPLPLPRIAERALNCATLPRYCWVATPFDEGEYSTDEMIRMRTHHKVPSSIHYQFFRIVEHHRSDLFIGTVLH